MSDDYYKSVKTRIENGFATLKVDSVYKVNAQNFLERWLSDEQFIEYVPQIKHLIDNNYWDFILDCFYQIIPFGTGGRRGEVGIGPNRINKWTIQASAQGHAQYLKKIYKGEVESRGVVLAYGVREFFTNNYFNNAISNPVKNLKGKDLAFAAAQVYAANGVRVYIFESPRTTPELSFAVRYLHALAGDMFDASHNPPEHNGKKVYDEYGGQLIPPNDEILVNEVVDNVKSIKTLDIDEAIDKKLITFIGEDVDGAYISAVKKLSRSKTRGIKIVYTPLHGVGTTSIFRVLTDMGFEVYEDPKTKFQSGKFENVTFNIPNPEVRESFDTTLEYAKEINADIILNSDPDADRIGVMVRDKNEWVYMNGNEIGVILTKYALDKMPDKLTKKPVVIKTTVTTNLSKMICEAYGAEVISELPVGFKYIGEEMNLLENPASQKFFLFGLEESHGYIAGGYSHDKDSAVGGLWLAELASELKLKGQTLVDYLTSIYNEFGYFRNYLTEIRLPGAEGMSQIRKIQSTLRSDKPSSFGKFIVERVEDFWDRTPIVSETDRASKDLLIFHIEPFSNYVSIKITLRPSGTEPKAKMYFEIGNKKDTTREMKQIKSDTESDLKLLEKSFMLYCYKVLGVDFPERGFEIFWQVPMKDKLKYFEIEPQIIELKNIKDVTKRKSELNRLLAFLGNDAIEKVDAAFKRGYKKGIREYLNI